MPGRSRPEAEPRYATRRAARRRSLGDDINRVSSRMGAPLMPWQYRVVDVATEHRVKSWIPYRKTVLCTVPRQSGKSLMVSAVAVEHLLRKPRRYAVLIAQTRIAATSRLRDIAEHLATSGLDPEAKFTAGVGNEKIRFSNGSRLEVQSPKATSVHGESVSLAIIDEAFAVPPEILSGVVPAMVARPEAQLWVISTAGTESSQLLNGMLDQARENPQGDVAFFEWSMPDDAHPYEKDRWWEFMPALGHTVSVASVDAARAVMSLPEFRRAFGNISIREDNRAAIPPEWWRDCVADLVPEIGLCLAVDVNRSPPGWAISAAWPTEQGYHGDLVEHGYGLELTPIPGRIRELVERFQPAAIGLDPIGPAGALLPDFESIARDHAVPLRTFNGRDRARADVMLFDQLRDGTFSHSHSIPLETAVEGAHAGERGDLWFFSRPNSFVDISPLLAVSMATWLARETETLAPVFEIY